MAFKRNSSPMFINDFMTIEEVVGRETSESPEPHLPSTTEVNDFKSPRSSPSRSYTHPQGPSKPRTKLAAYSFYKRRQKIKSHESVSFNHPKRQCTGNSDNTDFSDTTNFSESFAETEVWDQKIILSLDGGGIRGYSALLILQALMRAIGKIEREHPDDPAESSFHPLPPTPSIATDAESTKSKDTTQAPTTDSSPWLPCHYFDYMAGTSTGGLISIMLGRLRMNIDDCICDYEYFGDKVFGHSRWFHLRSPLFWVRDKYSHKVLEEAVREVVDKRVPYVASFPGGRNFAFDENRCRTVVFAYQQHKTQTTEKTYIFRTYKNLHRGEGAEQKLLDRNPGLAHDIPIWQVARATSAAPTYFAPLKIGDLGYLDGGFGATNNPCQEIYDEVRRMNNNSEKCVKVVFSVGTGKNNKLARFNGTGILRYWNYVNFAKKWASESETAHQNMLGIKRRIASDHDRFDYYRLSAEKGLDDMKLDEWRVRGAMRTKIGEVIGRLRTPKTTGSRTGFCDAAEKDEEGVTEKDDTPLSTPEQLQELRIPEWFRPKNSTLDSIRTHTRAYLGEDKVKQSIENCAKILVAGRRLRAEKNPQKWEKACFGAWYQCNIDGCHRAEKVYEKRHDVEKHFWDKHRAEYPTTTMEGKAKLQEALDKCKIVVH